MASAQVLNGEEQAIFDELISATLGKADVNSEPIIRLVTLGFIKNYHKDKLALQIIDQHDWSGEPAKPYPQVIPAQVDPVEFRHLGPVPQGSKAGVVYADGTDSTARKWLVAFDGQAKKVYVEAGPIGPVDWNVIEVKLDASEDVSKYQDPILGGKAAATFKGYRVAVLFSN
ncbi:uncharacterized protein LOC104895316 [Beta vulgaris subsp. vulgaris]|uniref:uncharacterized protein LOC104895316 n=1 Tax=Beta vulgaris subsp. vulgaris TaxID=3555 RepID=UPI0025477E4A|nr:uncharacterized protein LOC104895316 [Beta vulgaris subsp. vulgaris]